MKKRLIRILAVLIALTVSLALASCNIADIFNINIPGITDSNQGTQGDNGGNTSGGNTNQGGTNGGNTNQGGNTSGGNTNQGGNTDEGNTNGGNTNQGGNTDNNGGSNEGDPNGGSNEGGSGAPGTDEGGNGEGNPGEGGDNTDNPAGEDDPKPEIEYDPDKFQLVRDGVAQFTFSTTHEAGSTAVHMANQLVSYLRNCGVEINDVVREGRLSDVTEYEIIIGTGAVNHKGTLSVSDKYLGPDGYIIQSFGTKIIIAGGTAAKTSEAFAKFIDEYLGIDVTAATDPILKVEFDKFINEEVLTAYDINSITLAGSDFAQYVFYLDTADSGYTYDLESLQEEIYEKSGYWITIINEGNLDKYSKKFIVRYVDDAGEDGFRAYFKGYDFIVECAYINCLMDSLEELVNDQILSKTGDISIPADINYTKHVSTVKYSDFGAKGDGETDDYQAIYDAHAFANAGGQKVYADEGAIYYLNYTPYPFVVKTDVDFGDAVFIIDDRGSNVYSVAKNGIFHVVRDSSVRKIYRSMLEMEYGMDYDFSLTAELYPDDPNASKSIPWLADFLVTDSMIRIYNSEHRDFIRHGSNQNSGNVRTDVLIVDAEGNISEDTPLAYDFEKISEIHIFSLDDKPITINGGTFQTISCRVVAETEYKNKWVGYRRGFYIARSNVTMTNIDHVIISEAKLGDYPQFEEGTPEYIKYQYTPDDKHEDYGSRREGYAYNCFLFFTESANALLKDSTVQGHTYYYEEKAGTATDGKEGDAADRINYVAQGTYDFVMEYSIGVTFDNVKQTKGLTDKTNWGIMSSNGSKNLTFQNGCEISRFDAHRGFWNATLIDTKIGHTFHIVGGGKLHVERVTVMSGDRFMRSRSDYGSTFRGDIYVKDSKLEAFKYDTGNGLPASKYATTYVYYTSFSHSNEGYLNWDFGYDCYMPINITIDGFETTGTGTLYMFEKIKNSAFDTNYLNAYHKTQSITYKGIKSKNNQIQICPSAAATGDYSEMYNIPFKKKD